jgi:hypothetical protein
MTYILRITHNLDLIDSKFIDNEMNTIALEHNAVYTNYDLETEYDAKTDTVQVTNAVYEWALLNPIELLDFLNALPKTYKPSQILKKVSHLDSYVIFKKSGPADFKRFSPEDKEIYIAMLQKLKANQIKLNSN